MDESPPSPADPSRPRPRWSHDWYPLEGYLNLHYSHMDRLVKSGTVLDHSLVWVYSHRPDGELFQLNLEGRVECASGVTMEVDKWLSARRGRDNHVFVKTYSYSYHAWRTDSELDILTYDTSHGPDELHRHFYDHEGELVEVREIALDELPSMAEIIEEAVELAGDTGDLR